MTIKTERQTRELTSADLDDVVAAGRGPSVADDLSLVGTLDGAGTGTHGTGGGGGAGKVQMQDFHFVAK